MALTGQANIDREYMRRLRAKLVQAAGLGSRLKRLSSDEPLPDDERATAPEQDQELIERLAQVTHERDVGLGTVNRQGDAFVRSKNRVRLGLQLASAGTIPGPIGYSPCFGQLIQRR
jgi:hypothetical protein